ncbi:cbb3-type cytochrome c oxidase subunit 3 [Algicella marina]|uniref:CcoQ/FixQ family Cbb3-type cytochrome c oxidase assembly chaperone n=1 Tax=Algicella marina TaxID=2683284 RepID=A0A6P1T3K8_9RHOB|nr:cbb3-type cytochrome c oxidase subunit 3 [Algicella marina]QHQ36325.1 CcoQ/FixQ family Cbb3-type cytochrome c oxidase assembly chaperone [Algicella marina]
MDTYSLLREIADSWVLLAMFLFFIGVSIWAYLPSQRRNREEASLIPFRSDEGGTCGRACEGCACRALSLHVKGHDDV